MMKKTNLEQRIKNSRFSIHFLKYLLRHNLFKYILHWKKNQNELKNHMQWNREV